MKKSTFFIICFLVLSLLAVGCGANKPADTSVNLPVVSGEVQSTAIVPEATAVQVPANPYPAGGSYAPAAQDPALAYPVDEGSPTFDADMRAFVEKILNGSHTIEDLLQKGEAELREILTTAAQGRLILSEGQLNAAIKWLLKK